MDIPSRLARWQWLYLLVQWSNQRVQVDDAALYVWNYWSEVRVPFTEVDRITQSHLTNPPTVTIHLCGLSPYCERIVFIPTFRWFPFGTHPVVKELQALCDRAKGQDGGQRGKS